VTILDTLKHEKCDIVMSTMSPFDNEQRLYSDPSDIDSAMFNRFKGKATFKVGATERMVYEKVGGLKKHNVP
jgi:hypothetical protein